MKGRQLIFKHEPMHNLCTLPAAGQHGSKVNNKYFKRDPIHCRQAELALHTLYWHSVCSTSHKHHQDYYITHTPQGLQGKSLSWDNQTLTHALAMAMHLL